LCFSHELGTVTARELYAALDWLGREQSFIENTLTRRHRRDGALLLYDVTSTYFEGQAEANALARRGYSRDHRPDCKQVLIALVVTFDGFPLGYEVFAGNTHDSRTLRTIVAAMEARHGTVGRVWITDRGMSSTANLAWLRETGRRYIIGAPNRPLRGTGVMLHSPLVWCPTLGSTSHEPDSQHSFDLSLASADVVEMRRPWYGRRGGRKVGLSLVRAVTPPVPAYRSTSREATMTGYQNPELTALFETYTGGASGIGAHLTRLATEADVEAPLLVATSTDLVLYPGRGGEPSVQGFRVATKGFKELAAVSHLGPAMASLVNMRRIAPTSNLWRETPDGW
jgi:hypothetical protein